MHDLLLLLLFIGTLIDNTKPIIKSISEIIIMIKIYLPITISLKHELFDVGNK